jgi:hypothetical protein
MPSPALIQSKTFEFGVTGSINTTFFVSDKPLELLVVYIDPSSTAVGTFVFTEMDPAGERNLFGGISPATPGQYGPSDPGALLLFPVRLTGGEGNGSLKFIIYYRE